MGAGCTSKLREANKEELKLIEELGRDLSTYEEVAVIRATNITPWWGGDPYTRTHDPRTKKVVGLPTTETLKGVMLWIMRQALQELKGKEIPIKDVNRELAYIIGGKDGENQHQSLIGVRVKSGVSTAYDPRKVYRTLNEIKELFIRTIGKRREVRKYCRKCFLNILKLLGWIAFYKEREFNKEKLDIKDNEYLRYWNHLSRIRVGKIEIKDNPSYVREIQGIIEKYWDIRWLFKLFTIPRLNLIIMGLGKGQGDELIDVKAFADYAINFIYSILPVPKHVVRLEINVKIMRNKMQLVSEDKCKALAKLALASIIYAVIVHGLGRATSRGFGRFLIEDFKVADTLSKDDDILNIMQKANNVRSPSDYVTFVQILYKMIASQLVIILKNSPKNSNVSKGNDTSSRLFNFKAIGLPDGIIHPFPLPLELLMNKDIELIKEKVNWVYVIDDIEALSAIGYATLKNLWKKLAIGDVKDTGGAFHTWVLGLPRWQQKPRTGYTLLSLRATPALCILANKISDGSKLRRVSNIILFPVKISGSKPPRYFVVMLMHKSFRDHRARILRDADAKGKKILCHVGRHGSPRERAKYRTVVPVKEILARNKEDSIKPVNLRVRGYDKKSRYKGCGRLTKAGIARPRGWGGGYTDINDINKDKEEVFEKALNEVYEAAVEFIQSLLEGEVSGS